VFTADATASQPTGKWVGEAEYAQDRFVCSPGGHYKRKREFATFCRRVYPPARGIRRGQVQRGPGREAVLPVPEGHLSIPVYPCPKGT
jgi:hypothetical protein